MGYKIWRKDKAIWSLAFDTIYETQDKVIDAIEELKARYHELMKYGELEFLPYLDNIKLAKDGSIIDNIPYRKHRSTKYSIGNRKSHQHPRQER